MPSLEDLMLECGNNIRRAQFDNNLAALTVLEAQMDRLLDQWLRLYPIER